MPIELGIWRIDQGLKEVGFEPMTAETRLEGILDSNIGIAAPDSMVIGPQVRAAFDKVVDLLGIDVEGNVAVLDSEALCGTNDSKEPFLFLDVFLQAQR